MTRRLTILATLLLIVASWNLILSHRRWLDLTATLRAQAVAAERQIATHRHAAERYREMARVVGSDMRWVMARCGSEMEQPEPMPR